MKANELRIGNWLRSAESFKQEHREPFYFQVSAEDIVSIWEGHSYAQPIPLTTEILGMAGFEWDIFYQGFTNGRYVVNIRHDGTISFAYGKRKYDEMQFLPYIKYLHQLQNLVFALTATELEINLNKEI